MLLESKLKQQSLTAKMKNKIIIIMGIFILALLQIVMALPLTIVEIKPSINVVEKNNEFTLSIDAYTTEKVYGAEPVIRFNPSIVEAIEIKEGSFLKQDGASTYSIFSINNTNGTLRISTTGMNIQTGISGSGTLATARFRAKNGGYSDLALKITLIDENLRNVMNIDSRNASVVVRTILGDTNGDCIVNLLDLSIVGKAFHLKPGDPYWDPRADINKDNFINIVDLATVGQNYGNRC
jgi:hypothetical protein